MLVATQRANPDWMRVDGCPADSVPETSGEPTISSEPCGSDPRKCLAACDGGDGSSCWALALLIQQKYSESNSVSEVLFNRACRLGIASGCTNFAAMTMDISAESETCAARTFEYACAQADPWGCTMHGLMLKDGLGRPKDPVAAAKALDRACNLSDEPNGDACVRAKELKATLVKEGN